MPLPIDLDVRTVHQMRQRGEKFTLLDVRQPDEVAAAVIAGSLHIPMRDVPARLADLGDKAGRIVVHCHHGGRSLRVVQFLRQQGYDNAQNMSGGIDAWSLEIDPAVPRYE
jgi:rhodanese-related sulfurtransferase